MGDDDGRRPQIVYGAVVDRTGPIVQSGPLREHMERVIRDIIEKMNFTVNMKKQFKPAQSTNGHTLQYLIEGGYGFVSCAEPGLQHRVCMAFLEDVKNEWATSQSKSNIKAFIAKRMVSFKAHFSSPVSSLLFVSSLLLCFLSPLLSILNPMPHALIFLSSRPTYMFSLLFFIVHKGLLLERSFSR